MGNRSRTMRPLRSSNESLHAELYGLDVPRVLGDDLNGAVSADQQRRRAAGAFVSGGVIATLGGLIGLGERSFAYHEGDEEKIPPRMLSYPGPIACSRVAAALA